MFSCYKFSKGLGTVGRGRDHLVAAALARQTVTITRGIGEAAPGTIWQFFRAPSLLRPAIIDICIALRKSLKYYQKFVPTPNKFIRIFFSGVVCLR